MGYDFGNIFNPVILYPGRVVAIVADSLLVALDAFDQGLNLYEA